MEKVTTLFLKIAVILLGVPILVLCIFLVPELGKVAGEMLPKFAFLNIGFTSYFMGLRYRFTLHCIRLSNFCAILTKIKRSLIYLS